MTFERFSIRWASQLLALPAAVLLLATFSLAQPAPDPDPPGGEEPTSECPADTAICGDMELEYDAYSCYGGKVCCVKKFYENGECIAVYPTCCEGP